MFKLMVVFALITICLAHPSFIASSPYVAYNEPVDAVDYQQPALATIGAVVKTLPTSFSHASHAVVYKSDHVVQDVVAPVLRTTYTAPIVYSSYAAPIATYAAASPASHTSSGSW